MDEKKDNREKSKVVTTPEILGTPKNQQNDKNRRKKKQKKVDQDALLKPKKLQKHKLRKKKQKNQVATTTEPSEIDSDDPKKFEKIIDELSDRVNEMSEIVKKLKKTSDLVEKEKETPKKTVVECYYESEDAFIKHQKTVFVRGFRCSPPRDDIKSALIKHFSPCGKVSRVSIPFHCKTGSPMGFAFINMIVDYDKALTLNGSYLDGLRLTVTMAVNRSEYYCYTNRKGCERCGIALSTHVKKQRNEMFYNRNILSPSSNSKIRYVPRN
ncbi:RNA recognition motif domain-containing protein [Hirschfeldia incana]|nr:RNA recognition motif domain-containing protein [Hirschfeldia incana]